MANISFVQDVIGHRVDLLTILDNTYLDRQIRADIIEQLHNEKVFGIPKSYESKEEFKALVRQGYVWFQDTPVRSSKNGNVNLIWGLSKVFTQKCYIQLKRDFTTFNVSNLSPGCSFTAINDGFDCGEKLLGGYMTTLPIQVEEEVGAAVRILNGGKVSDMPVRKSRKEYVVNWNVMKMLGVPKSQIPAYCKIINIPFREEHPVLWWSAFSLAVSLLVLLFIRLIFLYRREEGRKRNALYDLADKKETLELAIEGGNTFAWKLDEERFIFETAFWELLDLPVRELTVKDLISLSHPDYREMVRKEWQDHLSARKNVMQLKCDFNGKGYQWWEFRYTTTSLDSGTYRTAGLLVNVQKIKEREMELEEARRLAEKAELKESFLANMSHEIRTPLNAIVGFTNVITSGMEMEEEERQEYISIINKNTELLLKLINDILELSRIESGQMSFDFEKCRVDELVDEVYQTHRVIIPSHLQFLKEKADTPPLQFKVDRGRLTQVLTNFLNNACKFTKEGYIKLGYRLEEETSEVHIYVEDTGKGIPPEEQKMIFSRFYKQDEFSQGTGLGLSISKVIIGKLGGRIELSSVLGKGSRFTVILPCRKS